MGLWIAAVAMTLGVVALILRAMLSSGAARGEASDLDVYRDQLREVERDRQRGLIGDVEADRLKVEVSRRLLEADRQLQHTTSGPSPARGSRRLVPVLIALAVVAGALLVYQRLGAPGYADQPIEARIARAEAARENRPNQELAEAEASLRQRPAEPEPRHAELMDQLRQTLAERPDDLEGHILLARNEADLGNYAAAHRAQERVLELLGNEAGAADWADYALLLVHAAGGYVSPEAEAAVAEVLRRDPENGAARYLTGLLHDQTGRPDLAFRVWRALLEESAPQDPWTAPIGEVIGDVARRAGVEYRPPEQRGPGVAEMAAAEDMSPEERQQMVRGMVEGLAERLGSEGGPAEDWARLITALGVLGETERASLIYAEARHAFGAVPDDLALIEAAAERVGIAE